MPSQQEVAFAAETAGRSCLPRMFGFGHAVRGLNRLFRAGAPRTAAAEPTSAKRQRKRAAGGRTDGLSNGEVSIMPWSVPGPTPQISGPWICGRCCAPGFCCAGRGQPLWTVFAAHRVAHRTALRPQAPQAQAANLRDNQTHPGYPCRATSRARNTHRTRIIGRFLHYWKIPVRI